MNKLIINKYIDKLTKNDISQFALKQKIQLNDNELDIIYNYIKNEYDRIINNTEDILLEIKDKLSNQTYQIIIELYNKYKNYLK